MPLKRSNSSTSGAHLLIWLVGALLLGIVWWHTLYSIGEDRTRTSSNALNDLLSIGRVSQEHAERTLYSADQTLRLVRAEYQEHNGRLDLRGLSEQGVFDKRIILQVSTIDAQGILGLSTLPIKSRIDLSDRQHFKVHRERAEDLLFVSRPEQGVTSGLWSIRLSRRISGKNGEFAGVVVVSLDPSYFTRFYGQLKLGPRGVVSLFGADGGIRAQRVADREEFANEPAISPALLRFAQSKGSGTLALPPGKDGVERIYGVDKLPSYPLFISVGMASQDIFAGHEQRNAELYWQTAIGSLLLLTLAAIASWNVAAGRRYLAAQQQTLTQLQTLTNRTPGLVFEFLLRPDGSACFPFASDGIKELYRMSPSDVAQDAAAFFALIHPDDVATVKASIKTSAQTLTPWVHEYRLKFEDGSVRWLSGNAAPHQQTDGSVRWHGYIYDATERKRADESLRIAATAFESEEGKFITDSQGVILRVNQTFSKITGYSAEQAVGKTPNLLSSGRHDAAFYAAMWESVKNKGSWQGEVWNRRKNGEIFPEWLNITAVKDEAGRVTHYVSTLADITRRKAAEAEIQHLAFYDSLTGLPNRRLFIDRLNQTLASNNRHQRIGAMLFIDLDNFKNLNDTHGHAQGDWLLQQVAERLNHCIPEGDTVARLGGDEFVVILQDLSDQITEAATRAEAVGEKILMSLRQPYSFNNLLHHSTASLGVTLISGGGDTVEELLKRVDLAMYRAKDAGRDTLRFFDPEMQAAMTARAELEADLRQALQENQLLLYYQPQVDQHGRLTGVEALVRWQHPRRGVVPPAHFISLAEETGLILPLGQWVLDTACRQLKAWSTNPHTSHLTLAINVSALQFHSQTFVRDVLAAIEQVGAPAARLKLELTESMLVKDMEDIIAKMQALKAQAVGFSLDDFGTGYSSLSYLKRLPLDQLKIDQSFLHEALSNPKDAAIVRATVALGKSLGLMVIAEGVETQAQRDFLVSEGCYNFQGYYFGRPAPVTELERFLTGNQSA